MKTILNNCLTFTALTGAVLLLMSCREKAAEISVETVPAVEVQTISPIIEELAEFSGNPLTEDFNIDKFSFKEIDRNGEIRNIDIETASRNFKKMKSGAKVSAYPLMEINDSPRVVMIFQGRGFGGPLWAFLLINKESMTIERLSFDHRAESEGYGAAIKQRSFEDQFTARILKPGVNQFILKSEDPEFSNDSVIIDGKSGATVTYLAVVNMMNEHLLIYQNYLFSNTSL